jgi:transposase
VLQYGCSPYGKCAFLHSPYRPQQTVCSRPECQRRRRANYHRRKLEADSEYRQIVHDSQKKWREAHPDYLPRYRAQHPEANERNPERQQQDLKQTGICVRVGMEATGYSRWFERLLAELGVEVWIGDPAEIKTKRVKKQKTDREGARLMRKLLLENRFP